MALDPAPRVVVLGAGFAGLRAVRRLGHARVATLWVDARNYHCFLPLLYQVATAGLEPQDIAYPARSILRRLPVVDFQLARVVGADPGAQRLRTTTGEHIPYSHLIVATGGAAEDFGIPGARDATFRLYDLEDARALRNHVLRICECATTEVRATERAALLTFVIVGGGATGVETAGALAEFRRHVVPRDYRAFEASAMRIVLVEAGPELLPPFPPVLRARARRDLEAFGVEVRTGTRVSRITPVGVELAGGAHIPTHTAIWAAGIRAAPVAADLGFPTGRSGRLLVEPTLQIPGQPRVFAAGDVALVAGQERLPQVAQVAIQQGEHAAENVLRVLRGEGLLDFQYRDKGALATIGRSRAVAAIRGLEFAGRPAWWVWLVIHLVMLIGFRNRLVVLVNWAWNYFTYDRGLRAIVGAEHETSEDGEQARAAGGPG
ncbi:MAG: NAD(P)/FAD-dependent oxidoreductase [Deltaproteobacteria bacterium]|nr:MAG: NAD(P)/FAD-dependent oxidoreductase [Deltaproteobacteria bacterium]